MCDRERSKRGLGKQMQRVSSCTQGFSNRFFFGLFFALFSFSRQLAVITTKAGEEEEEGGGCKIKNIVLV